MLSAARSKENIHDSRRRRTSAHSREKGRRRRRKEKERGQSERAAHDLLPFTTAVDDKSLDQRDSDDSAQQHVNCMSDQIMQRRAGQHISLTHVFPVVLSAGSDTVTSSRAGRSSSSGGGSHTAPAVGMTAFDVVAAKYQSLDYINTAAYI